MKTRLATHFEKEDFYESYTNNYKCALAKATKRTLRQEGSIIIRTLVGGLTKEGQVSIIASGYEENWGLFRATYRIKSKRVRQALLKHLEKAHYYSGLPEDHHEVIEHQNELIGLGNFLIEMQ